MGFLDDLYSKVGAHKGSWLGLPDFGRTEAISDKLNIPRDPTTGGSQNYGDYAVSPTYTANVAQAAELAAKRKASATPTTPTGGQTNLNNSPTNNDPGNLVTTENDLNAQLIRNSQSRLQSLIDNIRFQMGEADKTRDYLKGSNKDIYYGNTTDDNPNNDKGLFALADEKKAATLNELMAELTGVSQTYEGIDGKGGLIQDNQIGKVNMNDSLDRTTSGVGETYSNALGSNAKAIQTAEARNRVRARGNGTGGSSFFDEIQQNTRNTGLANAGGMLSEKAGKFSDIGINRAQNNSEYDMKDVGLKGELGNKKAAIGTRKTETEDYFSKLGIELATDERDAIRTIDSDWEKTRANLMTQEQIYGINNADELAQLDADHSNKLNTISEYIMNKDNVASALGKTAQTKFDTTAGAYKAKDDKTAAVLADKTYATKEAPKTVSDQLASVLASRGAIDKTETADYNNPQPASTGQSTLASILNLYRKKQNPNQEDPYGYFMNTA